MRETPPHLVARLVLEGTKYGVANAILVMVPTVIRYACPSHFGLMMSQHEPFSNEARWRPVSSVELIVERQAPYFGNRTADSPERSFA